MGASDAITNTLVRLGNVADGLLGGPQWRALLSGLSAELGRISDYRDTVLSAVIPSEALPVAALDDLEAKYGLTYLQDLSDDARIARLIERASVDGSGGPAWLQATIQAAGFPLYVIENTPQLAAQTQYGEDTEYGTGTQYEALPKYVDPRTIAGQLITSSPSRRSGPRIAGSSQYIATTQYGASTQYGTRDSAYSYPQPATRQLPSDPQKWSKIFFLSPFADRLAASSELLYLSDGQIQYLKRLVMQIKYLRNWCIAQIAEDVVRTTSDGSIRIIDDGTTIRRA